MIEPKLSDCQDCRRYREDGKNMLGDHAHLFSDPQNVFFVRRKRIITHIRSRSGVAKWAVAGHLPAATRATTCLEGGARIDYDIELIRRQSESHDLSFFSIAEIICRLLLGINKITCQLYAAILNPAEKNGQAMAQIIKNHAFLVLKKL